MPNRTARISRYDRLIGLAALGAIPLILLFLGLLLNNEFTTTRKLRTEVDRSFETRIAIQRILSLHQDIETGERGYVLTGAPQFLEPYTAAKRQVDEAFDIVNIELAVTPGDAVSRELSRLRGLSQAQLAVASRMIDMRRSGQTAEAFATVMSGQGKAIMDAIRKSVARIDAYERHRHEATVHRFDEARTRTQHVTYGLLAFLVLLLFGSALANARSVRSRNAALARARESSARQEAIFANAKDGMITLNESGSIESLNPAAARMYGYDSSELIRRDVGILFELAPDQGAVETFLKRLQRRRMSEAGEIQEFQGRRSDGSVFPVEVAVSAVPLGDEMRYLAVVRDATERKQVEQMKSEFVSTVSHELRTPLTSIAGSLGLLANGAAGSLPDRAQRLITIAHANSERLVRLINDILDIEKIESGKMRFESEPTPLGQLLDLSIQANRGFADAQGIRLVLDPVPDDAVALVDQDRMMQVLTNLLSNAIKFSPKGSDVTMSVTRLDRRHRITIKDHGPGIPHEFRDRIFSKFAQADSTDTREKGGTGLGLSIVREIVTRLGGAVSFDSNPGEGAAFHVDIPAMDKRSAVAGDSPVTADPIGNGDEPRLLHVEDDPDMLRLVASAFEGHGQLFSTPSLEEAEAAILRHHFDAVILDIGMAGGSGLELVPLIRREKNGPIIVFTAQDPDAETVRSVDAVLTKSRASLDRLVATVGELMRNGRHG